MIMQLKPTSKKKRYSRRVGEQFFSQDEGWQSDLIDKIAQKVGSDDIGKDRCNDESHNKDK